MIIADENIDLYIIHELTNKGYSVFSILENNPGISDKEGNYFITITPKKIRISNL